MQFRNGFGRAGVHACIVFAIVLSFADRSWALAARRFEICTFQCPGTQDYHFCQSQFDHLNNVTTNGKFLAMGSDTHRPEINANGNFLAIYYNTLNDGWTTMTGAQKADAIHNWAVANFSSNGSPPQWIILNEISAGTWPSNASYRAWVIAVCSRLKNTYNHAVIVCSPFPNAANNGADWVSLSGNAYIAIEGYLSGALINSHANSVTWCQSQYQSYKDHYTNMGVPSAKIYLVEHFAQTTTGTNWGRGGCSYAGWDNAINARSQAAHNVGFAGFVSFAWGFNQMLVSDADLLHFEDTYRAKTLP
jgi:hypothetical protein